MYSSFNLTIKSPDDLVGAILLYSLVALFMFYELSIVTLKTPLYVFRAEIYLKGPKDFEASGFSSCILNNTHFFWNQSQKSKKFHDVRKSRDVQQWCMQKVLFIMRILYTKFQSYSLSTNKAIHAEDTFWYKIYMCQCQNCNICM